MSTRALILSKLSSRIQRLGLVERDITDDLDLVRAGVLDSLGFVDLVADLESATGRQIDLEHALDQKGATTIKGLVGLFS